MGVPRIENEHSSEIYLYRPRCESDKSDKRDSFLELHKYLCGLWKVELLELG